MAEDEGLVVKSAAELKKELTEAEARFEDYIARSPALYAGTVNPQEVLKAEKEYFALEQTRLDWANTVLDTIFNPDPESYFQGIKQYDSITKQYITTYFPKKSARVRLQNQLGIKSELLRCEQHIVDWGSQENYIEEEGKDKFGKPITKRTLLHPFGKELQITWWARAKRTVLVRDITSNRTLEVVLASNENSASCTNFELAQKKKQPYNYNNINNNAATRALNRVVFDAAGLAGMKFVMVTDTKTNKKKLEVYTGVQKGSSINLGVSAEEVEMDKEES